MRVVWLVLFSFIFISPIQAAEDVRLQLLWKHQFQFAGYYMAVEKGFYEDEGITVDLREFQQGQDPANMVLDGETDFAVGRSSLLIKKSNKSDLVALFAAFQQSPLMLLTTHASGIDDPAKLRDHRVMITDDAKYVGELLAMLLQSGVTGADFEQQMHSYDIQDLIDGHTDAMASYVSNEPYALQEQGIPYHVLHPKDYGFDMYSDILFTSKDFVQKNPDLTERFYRASLRGWLYAFEHIEETTLVIQQQYNSQNKSFDSLVFEANELKKLAFDEDGQFGTLSVKKFNQMAQVYLVTNSIKRGYDFSDFIYHPASNTHRFTHNELLYIKNAVPLRVCINPDWFPYEAYSEGYHQGMVSDYLKLIMSGVGLQYNIVPSASWRETLVLARTGKCDMVAGAMQTTKRSAYLNFSHPYLTIPAVVATLPENSELPLRARKIAVKDKSAFHDIISSRFPTAEIVPVTSALNGLRMVLRGEVHAFVGAEASIAHKLREQTISGIKINDRLHDHWDISFAVSPDNAVLLSILNKAVEKVPNAQRDRILQNWIKVEYSHSFDYSILWKVLGIVAVLAGLALYRHVNLLSYNKQLQKLADRDSLTGILSRRKLRDELEGFVELSDRHDWPLSLIFFDIDDFKQINDSLGHAKGDNVLIDITQRVSEKTRKSDRFGRWGGEEFVFVMLESDLSHACMTAEKIRSEVAGHDFSIGRQVSCSFGVAQYQKNETIEHFMSRADEAMYLAKAKGKNCVCAAEAGSTEEGAEVESTEAEETIEHDTGEGRT
jgi:polar amino acid transport system substrate-binding protein